MKKRWLVPLLFVITAGVVGFGFTEEKAQKVQKMNYKYQTVRAVNPGSRAAALNPLRKDAYPELSQTVKEYYKKLGNDRDFIEAYDNIRVYTKVGRYTGSYVVFARYKMKVKDIYTKIPGLGTLYIEKDGTSGEYEIKSGIEDDELKEYVTLVSAHKDVQALLKKTNKEYKKAVDSDALLKEALLDLKNAYEG